MRSSRAMTSFVTRIERGENAFRRAYEATVDWFSAEERASQFASFFSDLTDCEVAVCRDARGISGRAVVWHDVHARIRKTGEEFNIPNLMDYRTVYRDPHDTNLSMIESAVDGWIVGIGGEVYSGIEGENVMYENHEIELSAPLKLDLSRHVIFPWFIKSIFISICGYKDRMWLSNRNGDPSRIWVNDDGCMCQMNTMCPKCGVILTAGICFNCGFTVNRYQRIDTPFGPVSSRPHVNLGAWGLVPEDLVVDGTLPLQAQRCILLTRIGEQK